MDSATQFLLGASIAGATLGSRIGARALLVGGVVGTLPDLDSLIPMGNAIDAMTYHRGFSHSVLVQTAAAPAVAYLAGCAVRSTRGHGPLLLLTVWLCLVTHSLLDSLTTYGTQILWPLGIGPPVAFPSVFIIDPVYSLFLLGGVLGLFAFRRRLRRGVRINHALLAMSVLYLGIGMSGNMIVRARAETHPAFANMRIHVQPTPFNLFFWQVLGIDETHYVSGLTGMPGRCPISRISRSPRQAKAPNGFEPPSAVRRLEWFTDGFYTYGEAGDALTVTDLRIGFDPFFVFSFEVARAQGGDYVPVAPAIVGPGPFSGGRISAVLQTLAGAGKACGL